MGAGIRFANSSAAIRVDWRYTSAPKLGFSFNMYVRAWFWGVAFSVWGLGFGVCLGLGLGRRLDLASCEVGSVFGFRVTCFGFRVSGSGLEFRVEGLPVWR